MSVIDRIAGAGCGCGTSEGHPSLLGLDEALAIIERNAGPVEGTERLTLREARGRVLAAPILTRAALPPFDNAAMDGYALSTAGLPGVGPWRLEVAGRSAAGAAPVVLPEGASAVRILTGAPVPAGADAVVMQEEVQRTGPRILLRRRPLPGENIRRAGEDMPAGAAVLAAGRTLGVREIAACAAAGHGTVEVRRRLRVALIATGSEIAAAGEALSGAAIWDVNTAMLEAALGTAAIDLVSVRRCGDDRDAVRRILSEAFAGADLVVTTGGISVGDEDHVRPALADLGAGILFSGVAVKPGKPISFGRLGATFWLGLPGNPQSAFLTWALFGTALLRALMGDTSAAPGRRHVVLARGIRRKTGRCELRPARLVGYDGHGREVAESESAIHSARVARLPGTDGFLLLPAEVDCLPDGALVDFLPFACT